MRSIARSNRIKPWKNVERVRKFTMTVELNRSTPTKREMVVRIRGKKRWSKGVVKREVHPRPFEVLVGSTTYTRNRRAVRLPNEETSIAEIEKIDTATTKASTLK